MGILVVPKEEIERVWPQVQDGIASALETSCGEATVEDTKIGLIAGRTILLLLYKGESYFGMVVGLYNFPKFKIARVLLGFGTRICCEKDEWELARTWAREQGCKCIEAWVATESRARMFRRFGFRKTYQIIRSEL